MRLESSHPLKSGGWLHKLPGDLAKAPHRTAPSMTRTVGGANFSKLISRWQSQRNGELEPYAATLGVDKQALMDLGACYAKEYRAFAFPMSLPTGEIIGIRLRSEKRKWAVEGSKAALFIPFHRLAKKLLVVEGPTDAAAGLTLGFFTVGRPNCSSCVSMIVDLVREACVSEVIIVCDNDSRWHETKDKWQYIEPGIRGAEKLAEALPCRTVRVVPPTKDLRAFVSAGGTAQLLESLTESCLRTKN
jgi:hypothetical protein